MALDPNIILSGQQLNVLNPIQQGLQIRSALDRQPFQNKLLQQGVTQGQQNIDIGQQKIQEQALERQLFGAQKAVLAFGKNNISGVIDGIKEAFPGDEQRISAEIAEFQENPALYISQAQDEIEAFQSQQRSGQRQGLASAKTEIFDNGTTISLLPDGTTQVTNPSGDVVSGDDRVKVLKKAREEEIAFAGKKSASKEAGKLAPEVTKFAVEKQEKLDFQKAKTKFNNSIGKTVSKIGSAKATHSVMSDTAKEIKSFISGLNAVFGSSLKSIPGSEAKKLKGLLDTMKANSAFGTLIDLKANGGTLGAISEAELVLLSAKLGSLDQSGEIPEMLRVIDQILEQNQGSIDRMQTAFDFEKNRFSDNPDEEQANALPEGVTESDVTTTMQIHGLTRDQVLERLGGQ
jgi:hypothetical protein